MSMLVYGALRMSTLPSPSFLAAAESRMVCHSVRASLPKLTRFTVHYPR